MCLCLCLIHRLIGLSSWCAHGFLLLAALRTVWWLPANWPDLYALYSPVPFSLVSLSHLASRISSLLLSFSPSPLLPDPSHSQEAVPCPNVSIKTTCHALTPYPLEFFYLFELVLEDRQRPDVLIPPQCLTPLNPFLSSWSPQGSALR
jgi:hypothetical protein